MLSEFKQLKSINFPQIRLTHCDRVLAMAFAILISAFVAVAWLKNYQKQADPGNAAPQEQHTSTEKWIRMPAEPVSAPPPEPDPNRNEWREEEDLQAQRDMAEWAAWAVIVGIGSMMLTALGVFLVWQTLKETRKATAAAIEAAEALPKLERAHLFMRNRGLHWTSKPKSSIRIAKWNYDFFNYGKTPAIIKGLSVGLICSEEIPDNSDSAAVDLGFEWVLESREESDTKNADLEVDEIEFAAIRARTKFIWLCGVVSYEDIFGDEHTTRFRWRTNPHDKGVIPEGGKPHNERT